MSRLFIKAKKLALDNKDKVAESVNKATDFVDKKTGGKHTDKLKKVDEAAAKFGGTPAQDSDSATTEDGAPTETT